MCCMRMLSRLPGAANIAQCAKLLPHTPDNPTLIPAIHVKVEVGTNSTMLPSGLHDPTYVIHTTIIFSSF